MKKAVMGALSVALLLSNSGQVYATTVTGVRSLNNLDKRIDYKDTQYDNDLSIPASVVERTQDLGVQDTSVVVDKAKNDSGYSIASITDKELAWLIQHDIVSRVSDIQVNGSKIDVSATTPLVSKKGGEPVKKSDLLVGIYKAAYGPIRSRTLLFNYPSVRIASEIVKRYDEFGNEYEEILPQRKQTVSTGADFMYDLNGRNTRVSFPYGDFYSYVSTNVYELYFKELLDKNIISLQEMSDVDFQETYKKLGVQVSQGQPQFPNWYNQLPPFSVNRPGIVSSLKSAVIDAKVQPLGKSFVVSNLPYGATDGVTTPNVSIKYEEKDYFVSESVDTISALKYIESILRLTEKDMTNTEAQIVTYKYGSSYLNFLNESDKRTVMFLTAKGVLNFEDNNEYKNLYGALTQEFYYKLLYRLSNKDARLNFSAIQLTDSDNFWLEKGFAQIKLSINTVNPSKKSELSSKTKNYLAVPDIHTLSVEEVKSVASAGKSAGRMLSGRDKKILFAANENPTRKYSVKKVLDSLDKYSYQGVPLSKLTKGEKVSDDIVGHEKASKESDAIVVEFQVTATSMAMALSTINIRLQCLYDGYFVSQQINAVTKYTEDGKEVTLIPESLFNLKDSKISKVQDKMLVNTETGATAVLLQDQNMALIGNHIISSTDLMVMSINGERYYNMDIISKLMSNVYVSQLDPNSIYFSPELRNEELAYVQASTGSFVGKTYVAKFKNLKSDGSDLLDDEGMTQDDYFVNISQMSSGQNIMIRDFSMVTSQGERKIFKAILQFRYREPDSNAHLSGVGGLKDNPSVKDISDFFYTRPKLSAEDGLDGSSRSLQEWWDNNIEISNAFANVFYGTRGVNYIRSGYLAPSVSILYDSDTPDAKDYVNTVLQQVGAELPADWYSKFIGDTSMYNDKVQESEDKINGDGIYYPSKRLATNLFPKWVHAMFNNDSVFPLPDDRKNSYLWRVMMQDRVFDEIPSVQLVGNNYLYNTKSGVFIVSNNGQGSVYKKADPGDLRLKMWYDSENKIVVLGDTAEFEHYLQGTYRYVTLGNYKFLVKSSDGNKLNLVDFQEVGGSPYKTQRGSKEYYELRSQGKESAIRSRYSELQALFSCKTSNTDNISCTNYEGAVDSFDSASHVSDMLITSSSEGYFVYDDRSVINEEDPATFIDSNNRETKRYSDVYDKDVKAHVSIQIKMNYWAVNQNGELYPRRLPAAFQTSSIQYGSVTRGVIDSIMLKAMEAKDLNELEGGTKVYIGNNVFTKIGENFISYPIKIDSVLMEAVGDATNTDKVLNSALKYFSKYRIFSGQQGTPLSSFIQSAKLSMPAIDDKFENALVAADNVVYVMSSSGKVKSDKTPYSRDKVSAIDLITLSLSFHNGLKAIPISEDKKEYQMLYSTNSLGEGRLLNIPFFNESLSLKAQEDLYLSAVRENFRPNKYSSDIKKNFQSMYEKSFHGDMLALLGMLVCLICSYLVVMIWIGYAVLNHGVGLELLHRIREPVSGGGKRIDLLKIASLGTLNLDMRMKISVMLVSNILLLGVIYLAISLFGRSI